MGEIKGTWLVDLVRILRAAKDKNFSAYLTPEDQKIIATKILASQWYPFDTYLRVGLAVFKEVGRSNLDASRAFGRLNMQNLMETYQNLLAPGDPAEGIRKYDALRGSFFRKIASGTRLVKCGPKEALAALDLVETDRIGEVTASFAYQLAGNFEVLVEKCGGKQVTVKLIKAPGGYEFLMTWK